jgi:hypothetical protein
MRSITIKLMGLVIALIVSVHTQFAWGQTADTGVRSIAGTVEQVDIASRTLLVNGGVFTVPSTASVQGLVKDKTGGLRAIQEGMNVRLILDASNAEITSERVTSIVIIPD